MNRTLARWLQAPSIVLLFAWMIVPLAMTIWFSVSRYRLLYPERTGFVGLSNYVYFVTDPGFWQAVVNTLTIVGAVLAITVTLGIALAVLVNRPFPGRGVVRLLIISPFFIMPTVSALVWKNMMMNPIYGVLAFVWRFFGLEPVNWFSDAPLLAIVIMVAWQWTPFAFLIFTTSLQSLDNEQVEAAKLDGAGFWSQFIHLTLPHLSRPIAIVILMQTIFHLSIFAEIYVTTGGGPGYRTTNLTFLIFRQALVGFDFGVAAAGGMIAVVLANIVSVLLVRVVGKKLTV